jgi:hypothetical protein
MPQLSKTTFKKAKANGAAAHMVKAEAMTLVDPNTDEVIATPSKPNKAGTAFADCTYTETCKRG